MARLNLKHEVYGKLKVIELSHIAKNGQQMWRCQCECGSITVVQQGHLRGKKGTKSCGKCNRYKTVGLITECIVANGDSFKFDTIDLELAKQYTWYINSDGYPLSYNKGNRIRFHKLLLHPKRNKYIDHIDRNPRNNCRDNLRICSQQENCFNQSIRSDNRTGHKGVGYDKRSNKYVTRIGFNGKRYTVGRYPPTENGLKQASKAYNQKAIELFGEYAFLNEI